MPNVSCSSTDVLASLANLTVLKKPQPDLSITSATLEPDNITTNVAMARSCSQAPASIFAGKTDRRSEKAAYFVATVYCRQQLKRLLLRQ